MGMDLQKFADRIRQLIPINELPSHAQNEIINNSELLKVRKGGSVFKQGDRDDYSFYVLDGEVELHANNQLHSVVAANTDRSRYAMAQLQPRQFTAKAKGAAQILQIRRDYLDKLMVLHAKEDNKTDITNYSLATAEVEVDEIDGEDDAVDWMTRMLQSELFVRMPTSNIHALFAKLEPIDFRVEDVVIKQGDPGEHYFIVQEGHCEVTRKPAAGGKDIKLAELHPGDGFGEEALISDTTRNATVSMLSDGVLMRLSKDDFIDLIKKPTLQAVSLATAKGMVDKGAVWLDVRFKNEFDAGAIPGAVHIPLNILRMQADKLDRSKKYIVYCDTSGRSSTGAFLLAGRGFDVSYLDGGLVNNPDAAPQAEAPKAEAPKAAPPPPPPPPPEPEEPEPEFEIPDEEEGDAIDTITREQLDPEVKATVLETELERTNMQLKDVEKQKGSGKDAAQEAARAAVERKLQEERAKIESAKKAAEEEAKRLREHEEERLSKMKQDAERRLQEEKKKLEEVYSKNAEEMERLQKLKQEAEEQMRQDRERLERESKEARQKLEEAQKIKKEIEASKRAMEKEAQRRRKEQQEMEKRIQEKARAQLQAERRKLAEQFARNNEELEKAKQERKEADAAREAARAEAQDIIAEYKSKHEKAQAEQEDRLREERRKLEEEQRKIQQTLKEIQKARHEAELARKAAMEEVASLRARKSDTEITQSKSEQATIEEDLRIAEEKLEQVDENFHKVELAEEEIAEASKLNEEDIERKKAEEAELKKQLDADLEGFKEELEEQEKKFSSVSSQLEHMRRIKQRAEAAKNAAKQADSNLLSDVASQLKAEKP